METIYLTIVSILIMGNLFGQSTDKLNYSIGEKHTIYSRILDENREIFIHIPNGFWGMDEKIENYPIAIVLDGESQFLNTVSALDFLSSSPLGNDLMPRTIIIGIPNTNRNRDLTPIKGIIGKDSTSIEVTGGGKDFLEFITKELIPYIDDNFSTSNHRTIIGHSLGGLIVFEALLNRREHFVNYLAIDPALNYDNESYLNQILDTLRNSDLSRENLYLSKANTFPTFMNIEKIENDNSEIVKITQSNSKLLELADSENWSINYLFHDFPNENHFSIPYSAIYRGMRFFYDYYPFKEMINYYHPSLKSQADLVNKLKQHYQLISEKMGYEIKPMESYINSWAYGFSKFERNDLSIDLFDYNIELYPENPSVHNSKGYFMLSNNKKEEAIELFNKSLSIKEDENIRTLLEDLKLEKN